MARTDKMKLGTFVYTFGFHPASWLHPASDVHGANDFSHLLDVAKRSEAACLRVGQCQNYFVKGCQVKRRPNE